MIKYRIVIKNRSKEPSFSMTLLHDQVRSFENSKIVIGNTFIGVIFIAEKHFFLYIEWIEIFCINNWQIGKTIVYQFSIASLESFGTFVVVIFIEIRNINLLFF